MEITFKQQSVSKQRIFNYGTLFLLPVGTEKSLGNPQACKLSSQNVVFLTIKLFYILNAVSFFSSQLETNYYCLVHCQIFKAVVLVFKYF